MANRRTPKMTGFRRHETAKHDTVHPPAPGGGSSSSSSSSSSSG